jgi:hypothetical protein
MSGFALKKTIRFRIGCVKAKAAIREVDCIACVKSTEGRSMTKFRVTTLSVLAALAAMSFAKPSYAHWGATSAGATYGANQYCTHADAGNTNVRRARVRLILNAQWIGWEGGGYYWYWDTVQIKNVSTAGRIDAIPYYVGPSVPPGYFFDTFPVNNLNVNDSVTGSARFWETNGFPNASVAYCQVRNG